MIYSHPIIYIHNIYIYIWYIYISELILADLAQGRKTLAAEQWKLHVAWSQRRRAGDPGNPLRHRPGDELRHLKLQSTGKPSSGSDSLCQAVTHGWSHGFHIWFHKIIIKFLTFRDISGFCHQFHLQLVFFFVAGEAGAWHLSHNSP